MYLLQSPLQLFTIILAVAPSCYGRRDMVKFFTDRKKNYFPDRNDRNGCKDQVPHLLASYAEAAELIAASQTALADLKKPKSTTDQDAAQLWDVRARSMEAMFGIQIDTKTGGPKIVDENKNRWDEVVKIFDSMQYGMDNDYTGIVSRKPGLYCGIGGWKYLTPDDDLPADPTRKLRSKKDLAGNEIYPDGAHYFWGYYIWNAKSEKRQGVPGICKVTGTRATTIAGHSLITWCDVQKIKDRQTLPTGAIPDGELLDARPRVTMSKIWVHELSHFYGSHSSGIQDGVHDLPALDEKCNKVTPAAASYGVKYCWNLAKCDPRQATHNADGYANFAVAMYLKDYDWTDKGQAKKIVKAKTTP